MFLLPFCFLFSHISGMSFPKHLSKEEESYYLDEYAKGSIDAKNVLIERNLRLVSHTAKKYNLKDNEDIISIGIIGLMKAVDSFDSEKGAKLATYATRCIDNEILMHLRRQRKQSLDVFMEEPIGVDKEGNEVTIGNNLKDSDLPIEDQIFMKIEFKQLYDVINNVLSNREKLIIELRYGLANMDETTQREISNMLNISRSYVSRIEKKALKKMRAEIDRLNNQEVVI